MKNLIYFFSLFVVSAVALTFASDAFAGRKSPKTTSTPPVTQSDGSCSATEYSRGLCTRDGTIINPGAGSTNTNNNANSACAQKCGNSQAVGYNDCMLACNMNQNQATNGNPNNSGATCDTSAMQQAKDQCTQDLASAQGSCDSDNNSDMAGAQNALSQFAVGIGSQMSAASACTGMAKYVGAANAAVASFTQVCSSAKDTCTKSCQAAVAKINDTKRNQCASVVAINSNYFDSDLSEMNTNLTGCRALDAKVQQGIAAVNNTIGTIQASQNCASQLDTSYLLYCKNNPTALGCSTAAADCTNPTIAASNPVCICSKNPNDPSCQSAALKATNSSAGDSGMTLASTTTSSTGTAGGLSDNLIGDVPFQGNPNWKKSNDTADDPGGKKGGRPVDGGAGGGSGGAASNGGPNPGASPMAVNSGFRGGAGGGGGYYSGGSGDGANYAQQAAAAGQTGPDLRQFLPGGKFDPKMRGIAGLSGPDGITGPNSNIWQKIQNRYQAEKSKLMP